MKQINHPISRKHTGLRLGLQQVILWAGLGWGIALLGTSSAWAQRVNPQSKGVETKAVIGEGYDPESPGNPGQVYFLTLSVTPQGSGSTYPSQKRISAEPGKQIHCSASPSTGFRFVKWTNQGKTISLQSAFDFTMPSEHVQLVAHFEYDPSSPANPDSVGLKHTVFVTAQPHGAGTFSFTDRVAEQHNYSVSAYPESGFQFTGWSKQGSTGIVSTESRYEGVMGTEDVHLVAHFKYDPDSPTQHGVNAWDAATGSLVVDYFTPNNLHGAASKVMNGASRNEVLSFVVAGRMRESDLSTFSSFPNLQTIDLKRTGGYTAITYGAFRNQGFSSISLPTGIERIEAQAFVGCENLTALNCYALTPPKLDPEAFSQLLTIYVPEASIPLYQQDAEWSKFTIKPLLEQTQTLAVKLPQEAADGRYKNCRLELINQQTGARQRYVATDRLEYTFNGLIERECYDVVLYSTGGLELGRITNVVIGKEDQQVAFTDLKALKDIIAFVFSPDGKDMSQQVEIVWYDKHGAYLKRSQLIDQVPVGTELAYEVSFSRDLGDVYRLPARQTYIVTDKTNQVKLYLDSLQWRNVGGQVVDEEGHPLTGVNVSLSQLVNGMYTQTRNVKTDERGNWSVKAVDQVHAVITFSATDYISQHREVSDWNTADLQRVVMDNLQGVVISLNLRYAPAFVEGDSTWTKAAYTQPENVTYTVFNRTTNRPIGQLSVQYPLIVLLEPVNVGDELIITASSRNGKFMPVECLVTVQADETAQADLLIKEKGALLATFTSTDNRAVTAMLYGENGELLEKADYAEAAVRFDNLTDGHYRLVTMARNETFNSMLRISQFDVTGLENGRDYVMNEVTIKSGVITKINNSMIPTFDASRYSFTGDRTSFTVNKSEVTAGNFLTLRTLIDFKPIYAQQGVADVRLHFDLPENATFVDNSMLYGSDKPMYDVEGSRVSVTLGKDYSQELRFCVVPTQAGDFRPSALVEFTLEGKKVTQPLGEVVARVKDISLQVPEVVDKPQFIVSGMAEGLADVTIYSNDQVIGQTRALANGYWTANCELNKAYNLSECMVYAKVVNSRHIEMTSTSYPVKCNFYAILPTEVHMIFNHAQVTFDMKNGTLSSPSYTYTGTGNATFTIGFTRNDTTQIKNVVLNVFTNIQKTYQLPATYDAASDKWVAMGYFAADQTTGIPVNVSVDYDDYTPVKVDAQMLKDAQLIATNALREALAERAAADSVIQASPVLEDEALYAELDSLLDLPEVVDDSVAQVRINQLLELIAGSQTTEGLNVDQIEKELDAYLALGNADEVKMDSAIHALMDLYLPEEGADKPEDLQGDFELVIKSEKGDKYIARRQLTVIDEVALLAEGYQKFEMTNNQCSYLLHTATGYVFINGETHDRIEVRKATPAEVKAYARLKSEKQHDEKFDLMEVYGCVQAFEGLVGDLMAAGDFFKTSKKLEDLVDKVEQVCALLDDINSILECIYDGTYKAIYDKLVKSIDDLEQAPVINQKKIDDTKDVLAYYKESNKAINERIISLRTERGRLLNQLENATPQEAEKLREDINRLENRIKERKDRLKYNNGKIKDHTKRLSDLRKKQVQLENRSKTYMKLIKGLQRFLKQQLPDRLGKVRQMPRFNVIDDKLKFAAKTLGTPVGAIVQLIPYYLDGIDILDDFKQWIKVCQVYFSKLPCENDKVGVKRVGDNIAMNLLKYAALYTGQRQLGASAIVLDMFSNVWAGLGSMVCDFAATQMLNSVPDSSIQDRIARLREINALKCKKDPEPKPEPPHPGPFPGGNHPVLPWIPSDDPSLTQPNTPALTPAIDPAGYVYEAVHSNRMEGVQASCYYKEVVEDMYGDKHENVVLWDAAAYAQKNPLFTDENGMYRWDVPQGLWQVKLEKEGYETTYSEWLPVPPPQLEVNLGMKQFSQPQVAKATAYPTGVEVVFDKYMDLETLEAKRFTLTRNGEVLNAQLEWVDAEPVKEGDALQYAKTVRLVTADTLLTTDEVMLTVSRFVKSYAGIPMANDFQQTFDIVKEVQQVVVDSLVKVLYGGEKKVRVSVLPFDAAIGQKVVVRSTSILIAATDTCEAVLDENGQAVFTLMGKLPGSTQLEFTLVEANKQAIAEVLVEKELYMPDAPTASRASGTAVYRGTTVALETTEKDAVIYYTTDGSCPCDASHRKVYTDPIVIDDSMLIKAYVVTKDLDESEVASFAFSVKENAVGFDLQTGWNWISHSFADAMKPLNLVSEGVDRFVSQSAELVKDPQLGMTGQLSELVANQSYKVHMSVPAQLTHKLAAWNPSTPIKLAEGWNWIGYPLDQVMTVTEAFELTEKNELDYIVGQEGFAQYDGTRWVGTLQKLTPGKGYLYFTEQAKDLVYNTQIVSKAQSLCAPGLERNAPWAVDMYKHPNVMCVVADLLVDGVQAAPNTYVVGAFSGTECRGIGTYVDRKLMMNVYGNEAEPINFRAFCVAEAREYDLLESTPFEQTMRGNVLQPYTLTLGELTNIGQAQGEAEWKLRETGDKLYIDGLDDVRQVAIYDATGRQVISLTGRSSLQGIALRQLLPGVHIVAVQAGTKYYYRKFVKH